jgi:hypothetical protein
MRKGTNPYKKDDEVKMQQKKDPKPVIDYVLLNLGTPKNLVNVEAYNYDWGEGKTNRWRVNIVTEVNIETEIGTELSVYKRPDSFFLHFDEASNTATYCNPPIERKY